MRATGITRYMDDLGRIVVPKEIRRKFNLREGEPLEIFIGDDGIIFKKLNTDLIEELDNNLNKIGISDLSDDEHTKLIEILENALQILK